LLETQEFAQLVFPVGPNLAKVEIEAR